MAENQEGGAGPQAASISHSKDKMGKVKGNNGEGGGREIRDKDPSIKISKNCKRFNRLFHSSFEESDDSSMNSTCSSSKSFDSKSTLNLNVKATPGTGTSNLPMEEILLEIEIQGEEEDEDGKKRPDSESKIKEELKTEPEVIPKFECVLIKTESLGKLEPESPIPSSASSLDPENQEEMDEEDEDEEEEVIVKKPRVKRERKLKNGSPVEKRKSSRLPQKSTFCSKTHEAQILKRLTVILKKDPACLTSEDRQALDSFPTLVRVVQKRTETRLLASERLKEFEDSPELLERKCSQLAEVIRRAKYLVVYSGAGISTSAQIPDYRGPNGIWTLLKNGQSLDSQNQVVLTTADPTLTHMSIRELYSRGTVKHIVSQNCDGLHLRSGIPKNALSEVHGNMYVEVCLKCCREYVRLFDVTENTRRYEHRTGRHCYHCGSQLRDTVVHFGERGSLRWPLNWAGAEYNANKADVILCIGSSLKVLRRYPWLWCMDQPANKRPKLIIVNLQWTPKDQFAALKIHGKCDEVMRRVMAVLNIPIPKYSRETDPIFGLATPLHPSEALSKSSRELNFPESESFPSKLIDINNYIQFEPHFKVPPTPVPVEEEEEEELDEGADDDEAPKARKPEKKEDGRKKSSNKLLIRKGNGNGWLGNAWGVKPKAKQRKLK